MLRQEATHRESRISLCTASSPLRDPHPFPPARSTPPPTQPTLTASDFHGCGRHHQLVHPGGETGRGQGGTSAGAGPGHCSGASHRGGRRAGRAGQGPRQPQGEVGEPRSGERGERERGVKRRGERSQTVRGKRRGRAPALKTIHSRETLSRPTTQTPGPLWAPTSDAGRTSWRRGPHRPGEPTHFTLSQPQQAHPHPRHQLTAAQPWHGR